MNDISLQFAGSISKEVEDKARRLDGKEIRVKRLIIAISVASLGGTLVALPWDAWKPNIFAAGITTAVLLFAWWLVVIRNEKKYEATRTNRYGKGTITATGIFFDGANSLDWELFTKYKIADEMVLLYGPKSSGHFLIFTKDDFSSGNWQKFTTLIKDKIG